MNFFLKANGIGSEILALKTTTFTAHGASLAKSAFSFECPSILHSDTNPHYYWTKMAETKTAVNLAALYTELNKLGNNGDFIRASKVAKKSMKLLNIINIIIYYFLMS